MGDTGLDHLRLRIQRRTTRGHGAAKLDRTVLFRRSDCARSGTQAMFLLPAATGESLSGGVG